MLFADLNVNWFLPPLVLAVSLVYGATRFETWPFILGHSLLWILYIGSFLGATYVVFYMVAIGAPLYLYVPVLAIAGYLFFWTGRRTG